MNEFDEEIFLKSFGENLFKIRANQKVSRVQLAFEVNTTEKHIRLIESGKLNPGLKLVKKISLALNISISQLFEFESNE
ncbi:MAG: helix-turn-helix transcriptional regulator [Bacteroidetes bacterium]|nr:helix-turn-helix transcriptional regulator [Bacteroidota bacterium]